MAVKGEAADWSVDMTALKVIDHRNDVEDTEAETPKPANEVADDHLVEKLEGEEIQPW